MSFSLDIKLVFIYSFQFSSSSLDTLGENDFNHLNLEIYSEVLNLVNKRDFKPMNTCLFKENSNKKRPDKNEFYGSLRSKEINDKKHQHVLKV